MLMQHLLGCLQLVVWSFWLLSPIVKILVFMLKGLGLSMSSARQQMQQPGALSKILCIVLSVVSYDCYILVPKLLLGNL